MRAGMWVHVVLVMVSGVVNLIQYWHFELRTHSMINDKATMRNAVKVRPQFTGSLDLQLPGPSIYNYRVPRFTINNYRVPRSTRPHSFPPEVKVNRVLP